MTGFKVGDKARVIGNKHIRHHFKKGDVVEILHVNSDGRRAYCQRGSPNYLDQTVDRRDLKLIEECDTMAHNNGDLIKAQVSRDDYGSPVYNLFVKFGEFYYNLSTDKQMRGCKSLPSGSKHWVGTMGGTGEHMLAAIEGRDSEVSDSDSPFDDGHHAIWIDDIETPTLVTATEIEMRNEEAIERLKEFQKAFDASGFKRTSEYMTTDKLSDVEYSEKIKADKYL